MMLNPSGIRSILVCLAHPDDESFPIGGSLAKYAASGVRITLVCATRGEAGIHGVPQAEAAQVRERELRDAADTLGLADVRFLGYRDGHLAEADEEEVLVKLMAILAEVRPDAVITFGPDGISGHADHLAIHRLTTQAFDLAECKGRLFYIAPSEATLQGCGVPPAKEVAGGPIAGIDVAEHLVTKVKAMQCHASQNPPYPGEPADEAVKLACHEYFVLARPTASEPSLSDLFAE